MQHDRYDEVEEYHETPGKHREEFTPPKTTQLNWIIIAGGLALALGVFSFLLLPQLAEDWGLRNDAPDSVEEQLKADDDAAPAPDGSALPSDEATAGDAESAGAEDATTENEAAPSDEPEESEDTESSDSNEPDYDTSVVVNNNSGVAGLAAQREAELQNAGFTNTSSDNWEGFQVSSSAVYFKDDEATALVIADELGIIAIQDDRVSGIQVVITG